MRNIKFNGRFVLTILFLAFGTGILLLAVISPLSNKLTDTQKKIKENEAKLLEIAAEIANYKTLSTNLLKVAETKARLSVMFPPREEMVSLVLGLESAVQKVGLSSKLLITDNKEKRERSSGAQEKPPAAIISGLASIEEIPYLLEVSGDYRALADLFIFLEHMTFVTVPDKLTVSVHQEQIVGRKDLSNTGTATAKLEGLLFIKLP